MPSTISEPTRASTHVRRSKNSPRPAPNKRTADEPAEEGADDPQQAGHDDTTGVVTRHDQLGQRTHHEPQHDPPENAHVRSPRPRSPIRPAGARVTRPGRPAEPFREAHPRCAAHGRSSRSRRVEAEGRCST